MSYIKLNTRFLGEALEQQTAALQKSAHEHLNRLNDKSCVGNEWIGWYNYPKTRGFEQEENIRNFVQKLDVTYDLVLVIGIGGSYLGTRAVTEALLHSYQGVLRDNKPMIAFAGHHVSETQLVEVLELLDKKQPVVNVISKSGTTTEPGVVFRVVRDYMEKRFGKQESAKRIICTTDAKEGALRQVADQEGYASFVIPDDIGGRFSVLTPVGLVPLALLKLDTKALMEGADLIFSELNQSAEHPVLRYAAARFAAYEQGKRIEILASNNPKVSHIIEWWKQLYGESEGKEGKGLFPAGLTYTTDLHSLGQYVQDGARNIVETFLSFEQDVPKRNGVEQRIRVPVQASKLDQLNYLEGRFLGEVNKAAMQGTMVAHFDGGVPCLGLTVPELSEHGIGALFAFFEVGCAISAAMLAVNPYDQPGVEAYKKNLFALLGKPGTEALGARLRERL
jgi:glucose-6-phosphate isomerase